METDAINVLASDEVDVRRGNNNRTITTGNTHSFMAAQSPQGESTSDGRHQVQGAVASAVARVRSLEHALARTSDELRRVRADNEGVLSYSAKEDTNPINHYH